MTMYHVDWNTAGYQACTNPVCPEEFHSESKIECTREYDRTMLPIYQEEMQAVFGEKNLIGLSVSGFPPRWTKARRPPRQRRSSY